MGCNHPSKRKFLFLTLSVLPLFLAVCLVASKLHLTHIEKSYRAYIEAQEERIIYPIVIDRVIHFLKENEDFLAFNTRYRGVLRFHFPQLIGCRPIYIIRLADGRLIELTHPRLGEIDRPLGWRKEKSELIFERISPSPRNKREIRSLDIQTRKEKKVQMLPFITYYYLATSIDGGYLFCLVISRAEGWKVYYSPLGKNQWKLFYSLPQLKNSPMWPPSVKGMEAVKAGNILGLLLDTPEALLWIRKNLNEGSIAVKEIIKHEGISYIVSRLSPIGNRVAVFSPQSQTKFCINIYDLNNDKVIASLPVPLFDVRISWGVNGEVIMAWLPSEYSALMPSTRKTPFVIWDIKNGHSKNCLAPDSIKEAFGVSSGRFILIGNYQIWETDVFAKRIKKLWSIYQ